MKRKLVVSIVIIITIILLFVLSQTKSSWTDSSVTYGPLNVMDMDSEAVTNNFSSEEEITGKRDVKVKNIIFITKGHVGVKVYINNDLVSEKEYSAGTYEDEIAYMKQVQGTLRINFDVSDDAEGTYECTTYTRMKNINKMFMELKKYKSN